MQAAVFVCARKHYTFTEMSAVTPVYCPTCEANGIKFSALKFFGTTFFTLENEIAKPGGGTA